MVGGGEQLAGAVQHAHPAEHNLLPAPENLRFAEDVLAERAREIVDVAGEGAARDLCGRQLVA